MVKVAALYFLKWHMSLGIDSHVAIPGQWTTRLQKSSRTFLVVNQATVRKDRRAKLLQFVNINRPTQNIYFISADTFDS